MIELFYANTPNGRKISIMLEEIKFEYKITIIDLSKGDQFNSEFRKISPLSKIPAIIDHNNKIKLFQSGAILIYLAELSGKFYDIDNRPRINEWLMAQVGISDQCLDNIINSTIIIQGKVNLVKKDILILQKEFIKI